jgi:hypothetical protein
MKIFLVLDKKKNNKKKGLDVRRNMDKNSKMGKYKNDIKQVQNKKQIT